jgi:hypothetical protein
MEGPMPRAAAAIERMIATFGKLREVQKCRARSCAQDAGQIRRDLALGWRCRVELSIVVDVLQMLFSSAAG